MSSVHPKMLCFMLAKFATNCHCNMRWEGRNRWRQPCLSGTNESVTPCRSLRKTLYSSANITVWSPACTVAGIHPQSVFPSEFVSLAVVCFDGMQSEKVETSLTMAFEMPTEMDDGNRACSSTLAAFLLWEALEGPLHLHGCRNPFSSCRSLVSTCSQSLPKSNVMPALLLSRNSVLS